MLTGVGVEMAASPPKSRSRVFGGWSTSEAKPRTIKQERNEAEGRPRTIKHESNEAQAKPQTAEQERK